MTDCIFCKIIKGELPANKVYETDKILAFLDIGPVNKGHTLVIPKEHYETLLDMPEDVLAEVAQVTKKVARAVIETVGTDGFGVTQSNKPTGGQLVPHFHNHIIPRFKDDGLEFWPQGKYQEGEAAELAEKITQNL
ncbi:HIT family protein [Nanoarchaeota archaeon]